MTVKKWLKWLPVFFLIFLGYGFILLSYFFMQVHIIYKPGQPLKSPESYGLRDFATVSIPTADGLQLASWYHPAADKKPTILFFHGNTGNIGERADLVLPYVQKGLGVFLFEYRGYGNNPGEPSETLNISDGHAALAYLQQANTRCVILYGESLGSGIAVAVAAQNKVSAVILQSPFTNLDSVAKEHYSFLPVELLLQEHYDSLSRITQIHTPLLIMHGDRDTLVPIEEGQTLYQHALSPKQFVIEPTKGHNDMDSRWMADTVLAFLQQDVACAKG